MKSMQWGYAPDERPVEYGDPYGEDTDEYGSPWGARNYREYGGYEAMTIVT
jgi:hypothetical protein